MDQAYSALIACLGGREQSLIHLSFIGSTGGLLYLTDVSLGEQGRFKT